MCEDIDDGARKPIATLLYHVYRWEHQTRLITPRTHRTEISNHTISIESAMISAVRVSFTHQYASVPFTVFTVFFSHCDNINMFFLSAFVIFYWDKN